MVAYRFLCSIFCFLLVLFQIDYSLKIQPIRTVIIMESDGSCFHPLVYWLRIFYIGLHSVDQQCTCCVLSSHRPAEVICSLLFLSGNVHVNPGPVQFPCGTCGRSVNKNHRALMCDGCDLWYHIGCVGVGGCEYSRNLSLSDLNWLCPVCLFSELPGNDVLSVDVDTKNTSDALQQIDVDIMDVIENVPASDGVQLIHHNVQGLLSKVTKIAQWLHMCQDSPTILCCSETWLKGVSLMPTFSGYKGFHSPLLPQSHSLTKFLPGSSLFVSSDLHNLSRLICAGLWQMNIVLNVCCCLIICKGCCIAIVSMYRSPSVSIQSAVNNLHLVLLGLLPHVNSFIIAGDVNINLLTTSCDKENYTNLLSDFYLQQHVCHPTRVTESSATLIDHVITTCF